MGVYDGVSALRKGGEICRPQKPLTCRAISFRGKCWANVSLFSPFVINLSKMLGQCFAFFTF